MSELVNLGILLGDGACNARCAHCAGMIHRGPNILDRMDTVREFFQAYKAPTLSISGGGEPTLFPHDITKLLLFLLEEKVTFERVKLYTNGIVIGCDDRSDIKLWFWRQAGLTDIYLTAHSMDERENAEQFGIANYPPFPAVFKRLKSCGLRVRVNLVLLKGKIDTAVKLEDYVQKAVHFGADQVCCWQKRGEDDATLFEIPESDMKEMLKLTEKYPLCVYWPPRECNDKMCLFPDGEVRDTWCR